MAKGAIKNAKPAVTKKYRLSDQLFAMALLFLLCVAVYFLFDLPIRKVEVQVKGQQIEQSVVEAQLQKFVGRSIWQLSTNAVQQELAANAWIDMARVQVKWPSTLAVELTEFQTIARWQRDALLNQYGEIFQPAHANFVDELPILSGPDSLSTEILAQYQVLASQLLNYDLKVERIVVAASGRWTVELNNGSRLQLGKEQISVKLQRWLKVLPQLQQQYAQTALNIDLRYSHGMAVHIISTNVARTNNSLGGSNS